MTSPQQNTTNSNPPHQVGPLDGFTVQDFPYKDISGSYNNPGFARATVAATLETPHGTTKDNWTEEHQHQTVLQQHITYFDPDHDGIIRPADIYHGTRAWGWSPPLSLLTALIISLGLSYPTLPTLFPDPFFRIHIPRIHRAHHGSSSTTYDNAGRFRGQLFDEFFETYDRGGKGGLTLGDLCVAWWGQRMLMDVFGQAAFVMEWVATWLLLWPRDGVMRKEEVRGVYDGSLFYRKAEEYGRRKGEGRGGAEKLKKVA